MILYRSSLPNCYHVVLVAAVNLEGANNLREKKGEGNNDHTLFITILLYS